MAEDNRKDEANYGRMLYEEMERKLAQLLSAENRQAAQETIGGALQKGKESAQFAFDLISELTRELSGIESFNIIPKPPAELEVDIKSKKETELPIKQVIAPLVEMDAVIIGKRIHFQSLIDTEIKGLRCNINEGFAIRISTFLGKQTIPIKGTAILKRDQNKQIVMETSTTLPGIPLPVSITIPLKLLLSEAKKRLI
ncbi:MAG: hypothetical protein IPP57_25375 [Candidatus Obscuribacter sp.]|nr:hypothetical protein [Candidatus Obscuribacter sp.]MBK7840957.1 hypothetical protein [Candidatus Obscuribacter sp.]MBK9620761.1 hypothetical protein [Candidatus Obscuribacter sp.]MBK9774110.1 hypothetical protein [Candidatus Obscuribacter sp.]MBL0189552.1 hypothetical protein [Candidatus Obscuribacter sp.]